MLVRRTSKNSVARLWIPPVANILLILFIQHGCEIFSWIVPGLWFQVDAVYLMFPLLYLRFAHAWPQVVITALALDAFWPGPYGTRLVIYSLMLVLMLPYRTRIRRENPFQIFMACVFMNLIIFSALWCVASFSIGDNSGASIVREIMDMLFSSLLAGILSYGWTEFQRKMIIMVSDEDPAGYPILY
jgi:hypothetical protein